MKTLKYAIRFLMRSRAYTMINLLGLALCLACCIILLRYIHRETTVDAHAIRPKSIAVVLRDIDGNIYLCNTESMDTTYIPPEEVVEEAVFVQQGEDVLQRDKNNYTAVILAADSSFFHFYRYEALVGEVRLSVPEDVLITESFAKRVFGDRNPVGETFLYGDGKYLTVRGVLKTSACKTMFHFDVLVNRHFQKWGRLQSSLLRLPEHISLDEVNKVSNVYRHEKYGDYRYCFMPLPDYYWFEKSVEEEMEQHGNRQHILLLSAVCLLVLLTGIINFVNLYLIQIMKRSREFAIKKVFGTQGGALFGQFWRRLLSYRMSIGQGKGADSLLKQSSGRGVWHTRFRVPMGAEQGYRSV